MPANDPELLAVRFGLAQTSVGVFRPEEALQKLAAAENAAGPRVLAGHGELALSAARARLEVLMDAGRHEEALPMALRLVELSDKLAGADLGLRFEARQRLSELYLRLDDKPKADALLAEITRPPYGDGSVGEVLYARAKVRIGRERINQGRLDEAETLLTEVRDTMTRAFGPHEMYVGGANLELADLHWTRGHFIEAASAAQAAVTAFSASLGEHHSYTTIARANLALIELDLGNPARALAGLDEVKPRAAASKDGAPLLAQIEFTRAKALTALGRPAEALAILDTVNAELLAQSGWGPRDFEWQLQAEKGRTLIALQRRIEGMALLDPAIPAMEKAGSYPWLLARYRKLTIDSTRVARR